MPPVLVDQVVTIVRARHIIPGRTAVYNKAHVSPVHARTWARVIRTGLLIAVLVVLGSQAITAAKT